jgi:hypothetical protein
MPSINGQSQALYLDLDYKANNPDNFIENELHVIDTTTDSFIRPLYGRFYKESTIVSYVKADGNVIDLKKDIEYDFCDIDREASLRSGLVVFETILVRAKADITNKFYITYRAVGGQKDANKSLAQKNSTNTALGSNKPVYYADVIAKPITTTPIKHQHDIRDYLGFEYLNAEIADIGSVFAISRTTYLTGDVVCYPNRDVQKKVADFSTTLTSSMNSLTTYIASHIATTGYAHNYSKASIGLGNLTNGGFSAISVNGVALPIYASPAAVAAAILPANRPAKTTYPHATTTGNVHGENPATVGLGNVSNFLVLETYAAGVGQYQTDLAVGAQSRYLTNKYLSSALLDYQTTTTATTLTPRLTALNAVNGPIDSLSKTIDLSATTIRNSLTASDTVLNGAVSLTASIASLQKENNRFQLIESNAPLARTLKKLLLLERDNDVKGYGVYDGVFPIPSSLENLYLWIEADSSRNTIAKDAAGKDRITSVVDRSTYGRIFANTDLSSCPKFVDSKDKTDGTIGLLYKKIALFENGNYLKQISGEPVRLSTGMTFFFLYRNTLTSDFRIITSLDGSFGVKQLSATNNLKVVSDSLWVCGETMNSSTPSNQSQLNVFSIADSVESNSWFANSKPVPLGASLRGLKPNATTWPSAGTQGELLDYIGNPDPAVLQSFEWCATIGFNRQLSLSESKVVADYLSLSKSNNQAYAMDYASTNVF